MKSGVLLMAHGTPDSLDDMKAYLRNVMRRHPPTPEFVREMQNRYRQIGGRSPLTDITRRQTEMLQQRLGHPVAFGMRNWSPTITEGIERLGSVERIIGICLAPHDSKFSTSLYEEALHRAAATRTVTFIRSWGTHPKLIEFWRSSILETDADMVLFTAHSVPATEGDPYPDQVCATVRAIADPLSMPWDFAYQSASAGGTWLGPDIREKLAELKGRTVLVAPIGFVSDHIETLYDLDIAARTQAERLGIRLRRARMPNDSPLLIDALADLVMHA